MREVRRVLTAGPYVRREGGRRLIALSIALLVIGSACSGPRVPVEVGIREVPTDVLLSSGREDTEAETRTEPNVLTPGSVQANGGRVEETPDFSVSDPLEPCPTADPFSAPRHTTTSRTSDAPIPETYPFRIEGTVSVAGITQPFPPQAQRQVQNVQTADNGEITFEVVEDLVFSETTTYYRIVPRTELEATTGVADGGAGIFITRTDRREGDTEARFNWTPPQKILEFPAQPGAEWSVLSTANGGETVMSYEARIGVLTPGEPPTIEEGDPPSVSPGDPLDEDGDDPEVEGGPEIEENPPTISDSQVRVDACGEFLQAWNVQIFDGRLASPTSQLEFTRSYAIGTQFGGISLMDTEHVVGLSEGQEIELERETTINVEPELASP